MRREPLSGITHDYVDLLVVFGRNPATNKTERVNLLSERLHERSRSRPGPTRRPYRWPSWYSRGSARPTVRFATKVCSRRLSRRRPRDRGSNVVRLWAFSGGSIVTSGRSPYLSFSWPNWPLACGPRLALIFHPG